MTNIRITNETNQNLDDFEDLIKSIVILALKKENQNENAEVDITIVTDETIREINAKYRNKDTVTDVLSFPMFDFETSSIPKIGIYMLGDIMFSIDAAKRQSLEYNHSLKREIGFFIAHSMLHLLGYDHETKEDEDIMTKKQEEILSEIKLFR
ncbi:MAG: rRNA maturation RNase YbeY [Defluviitaleaceae bacterium]|nr:rRNA maturation RNase YbeY [Defluviitaleaceae bacterium]